MVNSWLTIAILHTTGTPLRFCVKTPIGLTVSVSGSSWKGQTLCCDAETVGRGCFIDGAKFNQNQRTLD